MTPYQFQFEDFALSDEGVHLLRNRFNFKTIAYDQIETAIVDRRTEIKNALLVFILGAVMLCFAFYQSRWVFQLFNDPHTYKIYIESIVIPLFPAALGIYCIYIALRKGPVLILKEQGETHTLRLRTAVKKGLAFDCEKFLIRHLGHKLMTATPMV